MSKSLAALALTFALAHLGPAQAQGNPYRIVVGFPAGGTIDLVARVLAEEMKNELGAPVVVDSKPGAGGQLAAQALVQASPDGRTLLLTPDHTMVMLPLTVKSPGFTVERDLAPVGQVARYAGGFAVASNIAARNLNEYFAAAKANDAQANIGIPAPGSIPQFMVHLLSQQAGTKLVPVPYRGSAPLLQDLMAGQLGAGTTALGDFLEPHAAGKLRVIAVLSPQRSASLPDVPTFAEQGWRIDWEYWLAMFAPARTPAAEIQKVNAAIAKALANPSVRQRLQKIDFEPAPGSPEALSRLVKAGTDFWSPVVKGSGWVAQ